WTDELQSQYESSIARITASANLPFNWVDDPEMKIFTSRFLPGARPVTRRVLTSRLIPNELEAQRIALLSQLQGVEVTVQCDGWSGGNFHHYTAFTMTAAREVIIVGLEDNSAERKMGENLAVMIRTKLQHVEDFHKVQIAGFVSDSGGDSKKARRIIAKEWPSLIVLPCYAHQINLIVGDYFKC
ncbi:hypothetical protein BDW22DRAFT_1312662, partial [Trametopsis cervina]